MRYCNTVMQYYNMMVALNMQSRPLDWDSSADDKHSRLIDLPIYPTPQNTGWTKISLDGQLSYGSVTTIRDCKLYFLGCPDAFFLSVEGPSATE